MEQRLTFVTLGVADLERARRFYADVFGWTPMNDTEGVVFFRLNGLVLALFPRHELAADAHVPDEGLGARIALAHNLRSAAEVDALFTELRTKGVTITKWPEKVFWGGHSGYFTDPDGHLWEVAYNPFLDMDAAGNVTGMRG